MAAKTFVALMFLTALLTGTAGICPAQVAAPVDTTTSTLGEMANRDAYHYNSVDGDFQVTWPSACGKLRIRANDPEIFVGEDNPDLVLVHVVVCDRYEQPGNGCSVTATFNARNADGGEAGPAQVLARVRRALEVYNVKVVKQSPVKRVFPDSLTVEGIDVFGTNRDGEGQFWVRGLLSYHDIYLLAAWSAHGEVWTDPEYQAFFNEFVPYAE